MGFGGAFVVVHFPKLDIVFRGREMLRPFFISCFLPCFSRRRLFASFNFLTFFYALFLVGQVLLQLLTSFEESRLKFFLLRSFELLHYWVLVRIRGSSFLFPLRSELCILYIIVLRKVLGVIFKFPRLNFEYESSDLQFFGSYLHEPVELLSVRRLLFFEALAILLKLRDITLELLDFDFVFLIPFALKVVLKIHLAHINERVLRIQFLVDARQLLHLRLFQLSEDEVLATGTALFRLQGDAKQQQVFFSCWLDENVALLQTAGR